MTPAGSDTRAGAGRVLGPMPGWAVAAVLGALAAESFGLSPYWLASWSRVVHVAVAASAALGILGLVVVSRRARVGLLAGLVALVTVACTTAAGVLFRIDTTDRGLLPVLAAQGGSVDVGVRVVQEPRPIATGWHVVVTVERIDGQATRERAAVTMDVDQPPALGDRLVGRASARPLPPGGYGTWLARQHTTVVLDAVGWELAQAPGRLARASELVRDRVRLAATRHLDDRTGGLLVGFVTGDTRLLPDADREAMRATGLTHLTAVSGSNVAIVVGGVLGLVGLLRFPARWRRRAVGGAVLWFAFVTRFEPSVLRAGTMAAILLLASARGVPRDARHALCVAVLVLLSVDPRLAGSLGLLLSATATAGVLVVAPLVRARLPTRIPSRLAELAAITVGAQVAVVPLLLVTFGELSLASVPANLVAVPAAAVGATLAFLGTVLALVHVELGAPLFAAGGPASQVVLGAAHTFDGVGGTVELTRPAGVTALVAGCLWLVARRGGAVARVAVATVVVGSTVAVAPLATGRLPASDFTVTAIDVGQGDAFLIETPVTRILVDAGEGDAAVRWLRRNGRTWLDLVVISHLHLDHVGGAPAVLREIDVGAVWANPLPTELRQARELFEVAGERAVPVATPVAGDVVTLGDVVIEVLHPAPGRPYEWARSELNESSYVLRIHHGGRRVLVTGEVELSGQADLLAADPAALRAELMTVPHHGAATTDPDFLAAIGAQVGLISVGADNRHGHPNDLTLAMLATQGVEVVRTDLDGTTRVVVPYPRAHDPRPAHRRRRRPPAAARSGAPARGAACCRSGARRRHPGRVGDRAPPGDADHVAVRGTDVRRAARRREPVG